jgi:hypothetical protein
MRLHFIFCLSILLALLFIASVGAFLLYVPTLDVFVTIMMILGLSLMFALGLITGTRWRRISALLHRDRFHGDIPAVR